MRLRNALRPIGLPRLRRLPRPFALFLLIVVLARTPATASAIDPAVVSPEALASDVTWLKLGHFERDTDSASGYRSAIHAKAFFLSPEGRDDPAAELAATLAAFSEAAGADPNTHPQCRFPARYLWLKHKGALGAGATPGIACPRYEKWTLDGSTESISLVLATGYLSNPASFFGHILLKFNGAREVRYSDLLDVSVNYGAIVPRGVNPVSYVFKGAFGGYDGGFSHVEYYFHDHNYSEYELRDLWEYRLDLAPGEVAMVTAHAWEVLGKEFTYFFFRQNCAYRMAEIVGIVDGVDILPESRPWTIPQSVMQKLASARLRGRPLLAGVDYHPSRQSRFYARYRLLDAEGRRLAGQIVADPKFLESEEFESAPVEQRTRTIDALIDYYRYLLTDEQPPEHPLQVSYRTLLSARFTLPAVDIVETLPQPKAPHEGHLAGLSQAGVLARSGENPAVYVNLRGAYYDALDAGPGQVPHGALALGETSFLIDDGEFRLRRLDLLRVESAARALSGLPGDGGGAWRLRLGLESQNLSCSSCRIFRGSAARGYTVGVGDGGLAGLLLGGALQSARNGEGVAVGEFTSFVDLFGYPRLRGRVEYQYREPLDGEMDERQLISAELRAPVGSRWEARIRYERHGAEDMIFTLGRYW